MILTSVSCFQGNPTAENLQADKWAERLGFPENSRVLILHADDAGMMVEANQATKDYLSEGYIQSASCMVPCPCFEAFASWAGENSEKDIGLHITLTSEWPTYRWGPVAPPEEVPGLLDPDGFLWRDVQSVVEHANAKEVEAEIRAQVEKAISLGLRPDHIDTHMGVLYCTSGFLGAYLSVAEEYGIPALAISCSKKVVESFRQRGITITREMVQQIDAYNMPKVDDCVIVDWAATYEEKRRRFINQVRSIQPGITQVVLHPCVESENLKRIIDSWQQRVWEARLFSDPVVIRFLKEQGILFTHWPDLLERYRQRYFQGKFFKH
jgi:predicted glycoside hydrolase/deacetylase ChbG (UPF0249 family)